MVVRGCVGTCEESVGFVERVRDGELKEKWVKGQTFLARYETIYH